MDNVEWVERSQAGDREAFGKLVRCYERPAMRLALRLLGDRDLALDVVQDSFVKAYAQIRRLRHPARFQTWFFRIVQNTALSQLRALRYRAKCPQAQSASLTVDSDPAQQEQARELGQQIQAAIAQLSPKEAQAMGLIGLEALSYEQAAAIAKCSTGALRWHVFRARRKLKHLLKDFLV